MPSVLVPPPDGLQIRTLEPDDGAAVRTIHTQGIATGHATFETRAPSWEQWDAAHLVVGRLGVELGGVLVGWAALAAVSARPVYRGVAEVSVYVGAPMRGRGVGRRLLAALIEAAERGGIWTLQAGIFPENQASLTLHARLGFRTVGIRQRLARMTYGPLAGRWRDVVLLERRSPRI